MFAWLGVGGSNEIRSEVSFTGDDVLVVLVGSTLRLGSSWSGGVFVFTDDMLDFQFFFLFVWVLQNVSFLFFSLWKKMSFL